MNIMNRIMILLITLCLFNSSDAQGWQWLNPLPTNSTLYSTSFTSKDTGFIVGENGTILKTNDGGSHWTNQYSGGSLTLRSVSFPDRDTGYAADVHGTIIKTTNGGKNWTIIYATASNPLNSIYFPNPDTGFAVGLHGRILKTTNGGSIWKS
jgi:photosystem II stability/assembly factor-like uncharacterized protein